MCHAGTFHARAPGWGMQNQKAPIFFYFPAHPQMSVLLKLLAAAACCGAGQRARGQTNGKKPLGVEMGLHYNRDTTIRPLEAGREAGAGKAAGSFGSPEEHCTLSAMGGAHPGCPCGRGRTRCAFSSLVLADPRIKLAAFPRGNTSSPARCGREESGCNSCLNKGCLYQRHPVPTAGQHLMFPFQSPHTVCKAFGDC